MSSFDFGLFMEELAIAAAEADPQLRAYPFPTDVVETPALVVAWPESIDYDLSFGSMAHEYVVPLFLVLGRNGVMRSKKDTIAKWISRDIKQAVDEYDQYTDDPVVVVDSAVTDVVNVAGTAYLAVKFLVKVTSTT